jgi:hypothetical protein
VRNALASLPWVEQKTIEPNRDTHLVKFGINDRSAFNEEEMANVLGPRYRKDMTVKEIREVEQPKEPQGAE